MKKALLLSFLAFVVVGLMACDGDATGPTKKVFTKHIDTIDNVSDRTMVIVESLADEKGLNISFSLVNTSNVNIYFGAYPYGKEVYFADMHLRADGIDEEPIAAWTLKEWVKVKQNDKYYLEPGESFTDSFYVEFPEKFAGITKGTLQMNVLYYFDVYNWQYYFEVPWFRD